MGVFIKGMEMPKWNNNFERVEKILISSSGLVEWVDDNNTLLAEYEAVELPPHGRLIDADEAYDEFLNLMKIQGTIDPCQLGRILVCAPTIIEAEDSFFNSLKRGLEQAINGDVREITIIKSEGEW